MEAYKKLRALEAGEQRLSPMSENYPLLLTGEAEEDIIMALVFVYKKCGLNERAKTMAASLKGEQFAVFRKEYES
jgi:outer membrane protein assembly factor BamD (BamD/ComL family)